MPSLVTPRPIYQKGQAKRSKDPERSKTYLAWLRSLVCCVSLQDNGLITHHLQVERAVDGSLRSVGRLGKRPSDFLCVPLRNDLHDGFSFSLHAGNESEWWTRKRLDPIVLANLLADIYRTQNKDSALAIRLIREWNEKRV